MAPKELAKIHARVCQAFANPTRIEIIEALIKGGKTTEELARCLKATAPNISQHLKLMKDRGVVTTERIDGRWLHRLAHEKLNRLFELEREILQDMHRQSARIMSEGAKGSKTRR